MTTDPTPDRLECPNCQHPQHLPGVECDAAVDHGPNRWHRCLCLARPGAALSCPPQMTCQGGTLGYADIWYLQQGHALAGADGEISPEVLKTGPVSVGFPSAAVPVAVSVAGPPTGQTALRDLIAEILRPHANLGGAPPRYEVPFFDGATPSLPRISGWRSLDDVADAVLAVLPPPADRAAEFELRGTAEIRAAVYAEVADRLKADAEEGAKDGFTRIYRRSAADRVRVWANEVAVEAPAPETQTARCLCGAPIEWMDVDVANGSGWIHSSGSDTPCLDARPACPDPIECSHEAALAQARETNRRLNLRAQRLESELAAYRRAVASWEVSERGTYITHASLRAIGKAAGVDLLGSVRHLKHFERVEQAEAAIERVRAVACDPDTYDDPADVIKSVRDALAPPAAASAGVRPDEEATP